MARRAHDRLYHAGEADFADGGVKLLARRGETVGRCWYAELFGGQTAYPLAVHREARGVCGGGDVEPLGLEFHQLRGGDGLDFGDDMVGTFGLHDLAEFLGVEHGEYMAAVSHLHGRSAGILVACHDLNAHALQFNCYFFTKLAAAQQQGLAARRGLDRTYLCHLGNCDCD